MSGMLSGFLFGGNRGAGDGAGPSSVRGDSPGGRTTGASGSSLLFRPPALRPQVPLHGVENPLVHPSLNRVKLQLNGTEAFDHAVLDESEDDDQQAGSTVSSNDNKCVPEEVEVGDPRVKKRSSTEDAAEEQSAGRSSSTRRPRQETGLFGAESARTRDGGEEQNADRDVESYAASGPKGEDSRKASVAAGGASSSWKKSVETMRAGREQVPKTNTQVSARKKAAPVGVNTGTSSVPGNAPESRGRSRPLRFLADRQVGWNRPPDRQLPRGVLFRDIAGISPPDLNPGTRRRSDPTVVSNNRGSTVRTSGLNNSSSATAANATAARRRSASPLQRNREGIKPGGVSPAARQNAAFSPGPRVRAVSADAGAAATTRRVVVEPAVSPSSGGGVNSVTRGAPVTRAAAADGENTSPPSTALTVASSSERITETRNQISPPTQSGSIELAEDHKSSPSAAVVVPEPQSVVGPVLDLAVRQCPPPDDGSVATLSPRHYSDFEIEEPSTTVRILTQAVQAANVLHQEQSPSARIVHTTTGAPLSVDAATSSVLDESTTTLVGLTARGAGSIDGLLPSPATPEVVLQREDQEIVVISSTAEAQVATTTASPVPTSSDVRESNSPPRTPVAVVSSVAASTPPTNRAPRRLRALHMSRQSLISPTNAAAVPRSTTGADEGARPNYHLRSGGDGATVMGGGARHRGSSSPSLVSNEARSKSIEGSETREPRQHLRAPPNLLSLLTPGTIRPPVLNGSRVGEQRSSSSIPRGGIRIPRAPIRTTNPSRMTPITGGSSTTSLARPGSGGTLSAGGSSFTFSSNKLSALAASPSDASFPTDDALAMRFGLPDNLEAHELYEVYQKAKGRVGPAFFNHVLCDDAIDTISQMQIWEETEDGNGKRLPEPAEVKYLWSYWEEGAFCRGFAIETVQRQLKLGQPLIHPVSKKEMPPVAVQGAKDLIQVLLDLSELDLLEEKAPTDYTWQDVLKQPPRIRDIAKDVFRMFFAEANLDLDESVFLQLTVLELKAFFGELRTMWHRNFNGAEQRKLRNTEFAFLTGYPPARSQQDTQLGWQFFVLNEIGLCFRTNEKAFAEDTEFQLLKKRCMYLVTAALLQVSPAVRDRYSEGIYVDETQPAPRSLSRSGVSAVSQNADGGEVSTRSQAGAGAASDHHETEAAGGTTSVEAFSIAGDHVTTHILDMENEENTSEEQEADTAAAEALRL
ncbi:unnamed protein product [Amoebophrya sp. A25]|nr:unnamed protein product [Amoebophrya sp. A25]|eukprot:GSA25T00015593001.1